MTTFGIAAAVTRAVEYDAGDYYRLFVTKNALALYSGAELTTDVKELYTVRDRLKEREADLTSTTVSIYGRGV